MSEYIVVTSNLTKKFGKSYALRDLNIKIPKGISGFIGRNGAGKTTTIGVLLGLIKPSGGSAQVFGLDCWKNSTEIKRKIRVMHEINAYPGMFTGKQFLEFVGNIYGVDEIKEKVEQVLNDVDLSGASTKKIKTYSAGMFKRLGLAQTLLGDPELILLDEPTANIDPIGRRLILEKIKNINKERGTNFVISTHLLSDLEIICNWLCIIDSGSIVDQGSIDELSKKYSANIYKIEVSDPYLFSRAIEKMTSVEKVWIENRIVYCKVEDPAVFSEKIPRVTYDHKLKLISFQNSVGTIEEIFQKTVGENPK